MINQNPNTKSKNDQLIEKWKLRNDKLKADIQRSIRLIMDSGIDYEFRTTVCHPLHEVEDFEEIGKMLQEISSPPSEGGARGGGSSGEKHIKRYFIQNYQHSKQVDEKSEFQPFSDEELKEAKSIINKYVDMVKVR